MVKFFKHNIRKVRYFTTVVSVLLTVVAIAAIGLKGLNLGLDFTGGMVTEVQLDKSLSSNQIMKQLQPEMGESVSVTSAGEEGRWVIRYSVPEDGSDAVDVGSVLSSYSDQVDVVSNSIVGSQVGQDLFEQGGLALMISILSILGYLCFRFEWRLASGSLFALFHDVILVLGFFALAQMEFNLTVFAAILAILGYSLNDSIIIADRIRELLVAKQDKSAKWVNDQAVIATFSRTMVTSGTTLITVGALWVMGGSALAGFSTAMFIGVLSGTWSSISIGTVLPEWLNLEAKHYQPVEVDAAP
ncbi:protein-export membrane protein SecF [Vibrio breoganii]|uniref:Protein-export membrane protein SecF n=1 Tax=Vibrio breoganii TaxID=553239 RepID=A0AAN0XYW4_9VIBR|nr:protein translocase subunit SecF [Vibrio breoganii]ANO35071.1 protein-export membrane protein SecF [Vibrio breoganii]PMG78881.1 protein-export membrane protein SecF [Vibrio breoganii]PMK45239.1 protein-export membrane protein SecF [Vibrio breoganii]PMO27863.1 protein-export membrane protein SecF [Vibrio breoganii]PMO59649.1 protein-export membrane protein SecF [Vibrio breoganii]